MRLFIAILISLLLCHPAVAGNVKRYHLEKDDKETLTRIERYLTQIHSVSADFIQQAPGGNISTGKFFLERPGKLRMEYAPPTPVLMVTSGSYIIYYDKELDQVSRILLESTLVGFLAREDVKFDETIIITDMEHEDQRISLTLVQTKHPNDGSLTLEFSDEPLTLRNMIVTDGSGQITTVALNNARYNTPLSEDLFVFKDPHLGAAKRSIKN